MYNNLGYNLGCFLLCLVHLIFCEALRQSNHNATIEESQQSLAQEKKNISIVPSKCLNVFRLLGLLNVMLLGCLILRATLVIATKKVTQGIVYFVLLSIGREHPADKKPGGVMFKRG